LSNTAPYLILTGETISIFFGSSVSTAGDVNGDGYADVIVGAWGYGNNTGRSYIYYGGSAMDNVADIVISGEEGSHFGSSVSTAGDVNGDGYSDVIVGKAYFGGFGWSGHGGADIFYGAESMDGLPDVVLASEGSTSFGGSIACAGDV